MRRVVIHAGFHKTGTSSVQQVLKNNRRHLRPHLQSLLKGSMRELLHASRGYSTWRDPLTLDKFTTRFRAVLANLNGNSQRTLCLSAEELSGHLPGRSGLSDYSAAADLAAEMEAVVRVLWPQSELMFFFSTRNAETWLQSAYAEHVKSSSLTLDWDDYAKTYRQSADLDAIVDQVADRVSSPVHRARLEDAMPLALGPATPLLLLCGVPPDVFGGLSRTDVINTRPESDVLLALLAANRDHPDRDARKAAKQAILKAAREDKP